MNIAFDAKRVYQNTTGLGNYSRTLVSSLARMYPQHQFLLCAPRQTGLFNAASFNNVASVLPKSVIDRTFTSLWRSSRVVHDLKRLRVDLYHGLSHEIPKGIHQTGIPSVVTIHDLIFEKYPHQYSHIDVQIYRRKFRHACKYANRIIAISQQTKQDVVELYQINPEKIDVCYQSCDPQFNKDISLEELHRVKARYNLPDQYFLYVGSIIERKNLLNICKALALMPKNSQIPLVVIGRGDGYQKTVEAFVVSSNLPVLFLNNNPDLANLPSLQSGADLPAIYRMARALIYPSVYEGFGLPVLEALWSRVPVITSNQSCLPEAGGPGALYVDPFVPAELASAMQTVLNHPGDMQVRIEKGLQHAQHFTPEKCTEKVMQVYLRLS